MISECLTINNHEYTFVTFYVTQSLLYIPERNSRTMVLSNYYGNTGCGVGTF